MEVTTTTMHLEQSLLGAILIDPNAWDIIADTLTESHFVQSLHKEIFQGMRSLAKKSNPIDIITLETELKTLKTSYGQDLFIYLATLAKNCTGSANIKHYASLLIKEETINRLKQASFSINKLTDEKAKYEPSEMIDRAEEIIFQIDQRLVRGRGPVDISVIMKEFLDSIDKNDLPLLKTGFSDLDFKLSGGMQNGELIILAGRPGAGKTTLAMNIVEHVAQEKGVLVFSLEMTSRAIFERLLSSIGKIPLNFIRNNKFSEDDFTKITEVVAKLSIDNIKLDDTGALRPSEMRARARRDKRERKNLSLIVIDYLQLMQPDGSHHNKVLELAEISQSLKALAKELDLPIIALAQLNRNSVNRVGDKRPTMSDLRDSGSLEQDADVVALIYRDELYNPSPYNRGVAELIIDKQRNGTTGTIEFWFNGEFNRFTTKG